MTVASDPRWINCPKKKSQTITSCCCIFAHIAGIFYICYFPSAIFWNAFKKGYLLFKRPWYSSQTLGIELENLIAHIISLLRTVPVWEVFQAVLLKIILLIFIISKFSKTWKTLCSVIENLFLHKTVYKFKWPKGCYLKFGSEKPLGTLVSYI